MTDGGSPVRNLQSREGGVVLRSTDVMFLSGSFLSFVTPFLTRALLTRALCTHHVQITIFFPSPSWEGSALQ